MNDSSSAGRPGEEALLHPTDMVTRMDVRDAPSNEVAELRSEVAALRSEVSELLTVLRRFEQCEKQHQRSAEPSLADSRSLL
jgi:hypothetical protein